MAERVGRVLVTGGVRSGKSAHAESLLSGEPSVTYVAAGPTFDDADWRARIERHRARRPGSWVTVESLDVAAALGAAEGAVIVDCLGTWLTGLIDEGDLWEAAVEDVEAHVAAWLAPVVAAVAEATFPVVLVTNEVGLGVVPDHRSGRLFRDLLGTVNQQLGTVCDEVHLVVSGRVLVL